MKEEFLKFENNINSPEINPEVNGQDDVELLSSDIKTDQMDNVDVNKKSNGGGWTEGHRLAFDQKMKERKAEFLDKLFGEMRARRVAHQGKGKSITEEEFVKLPDDPSGVLYVYDAADGCYVKLATKSIRRLGLDFSVGGTAGPFSNRPRLNLVNYFGDELSSGALRLEDFDQGTTTATADSLRPDRRIGKDNSQISFNHANYYLKGRKYPGTEIEIEREVDRAVTLSPSLVAFVGQRHGDDYIKATLDLLSEEDLRARLRANQYKSPMTYVNDAEVSKRIHSWKVTDNNPKLQGESDKEYAERIRSLSDIGFIKELSVTLAKDAGLGIHNLDFREQQWLATYAYSHEKKFGELITFAKTYKLDGLKSFLSMEHGEEMGDKILKIGEKLKGRGAEEIFVKYSTLAEQALYLEEKLVTLLPDNSVSAEQKTRIAESLLKKAKDVLIQFSDKLGQGEEIDDGQIITKLNNISEEIVVFASIFKTVKPSLESINGLELNKISQDSLSLEDKKAMQELAKVNNGERNFGRQVILSQLNDALTNPANRFYLLKQNNRLISFLRFEDKGNNNLHFGSFNVDENAQGSGLGEAMMASTLDLEAKHNIISANVEIDKPIASKYIEEKGFVATQILPDVAGTGVNGFVIERDDRRNYRSKENISNNENIGASGTQSFTFPFNEMKNFVKKAEQLLNSGDYVITRYQFNQEDKSIKVVFEAIADQLKKVA